MRSARKLLIPFGFIIATSVSSVAMAGQGARIEAVGTGNQVRVTRAGTVVKLKAGDALHGGDELTTDPQTAVDVRLDDGSLIRVGVSSTYKLEDSPKLLTLIHRLVTGVVRIQVPKNENKNSEIKFRLYTPEGTIGVRGTEFVVIRSNVGTELKGIDGEVVFGPAETGFDAAEKFVVVKRGFQSMVKAKGNPERPEKFNVQDYLQQIGGPKGAFGPLSARKQEIKTYARTTNGTLGAASVAAVVVPPSVAKPTPAETQNVGGGKATATAVNWSNVLYDGVFEADTKKVREAIAHGADVNVLEKKVGYTPLQLALLESGKKDKEIVLLLLQNGANPNKKNKEGLTPLMHIADKKLDIEYAKALVEPGGANIFEKDAAGHTAADWAKESGYKELEDYLRSEEAERDMARAREAKMKTGK